jgi:uncharacterized protein YggE
MSATQNRGLYALAGVLAVAFIVVGIVSYVALSNLPRVQAQTSEQPPSTIVVSGFGSVLVAPDRLFVSFSVDTDALTAQEALRLNGEIMNQVIDALRALGITDKEIRTTYVTVYPQYYYPPDGKGIPQLLGYRASNSVTITTAALDKAGVIIDTAVEAGANRVDSIYFSVSDEAQRALRDQVLTKAVEDARSRAEKVLAPLNLRIVGVQSISLTEGGFPVPIIKGPYEAGADRPTPIFPGDQQVTAFVNIIFLIGA